MSKIFNIATYKRDSFLFKTIESVYNQADVINICLNSHSEIPKELVDSKINCYITDNNIGDGYKFLRLKDSNGYYFTIDDDLIYPPDYADYMVDNYMKYRGRHIVTLHGRSFISFPISSYYQSKRDSYRCLGDVSKDVIVQFGGTGVMMFHTDLLKFSHNDIEMSNMADIWLSVFAKEKNIKIMCVKHKSDFLKYQNGVGNETIFDIHKNKDRVQTRIVNERFCI